MCKKTKCMRKGIDPCMKNLINNLNYLFRFKRDLKILACCCGHKKYPMTIIVESLVIPSHRFDFVSGKNIHRKKRFYKRDNKDIYYIPEVKKW